MNRFIKTLLIFLLVILFAAGGFVAGNIYSQDGAANKLNAGDLGVDSTKLNRILGYIRNNYLFEYKDKEITDGVYKGVVGALGDPYSVYYDPDEYKALNEDTAGEFGGVGIEVSGAEGQFIKVIAPIKGTPAEKAGIMAGDLIVKINDKSFTADMLTDAVKVMRGKVGEKVKLTVSREVNGTQKELDFDLVREIITVRSVEAKLLEDNIGYVHLSQFQTHSAEDLIKAVEDLKAQGAQRLILDLRNDPGGLLDVVLKIADYFMGDGPIMSVKDKNGNGQEYRSDAKMEAIPMVTLVNGGSASASEVLSGALKESGRSEIIGENTFGKGIIQQIYDLNYDGEKAGLKLTVAEFFTPKGNKIHKVGIKPTVEVKLNDGVDKIGVENLKEDNQLQKAIEVVKTK